MTDEITVPADLPTTVAGALERAARLFPGLEALVEGDLRLDYSQLLDAVDEAARALVASGIEPGDRVAIWAPNCAEWVIACSAVHRVGAILVPLNTRFKGSEAAYILNTSRARMLFTVTDFLDTDYVEALGDRGELPHLEQVVVMRGDAHDDTVGWTEFLARATSVPADAAARARRRHRTRRPGQHPLHLRAPPGSRRAPCSATRPSCGPTGRGPAWSASRRATGT